MIDPFVMGSPQGFQFLRGRGIGVRVDAVELDTGVPEIAINIIRQTGRRNQEGDPEKQGGKKTEDEDAGRHGSFLWSPRPKRNRHGVGAEGQKVKEKKKGDRLAEVSRKNQGNTGDLDNGSGQDELFEINHERSGALGRKRREIVRLDPIRLQKGVPGLLEFFHFIEGIAQVVKKIRVQG